MSSEVMRSDSPAVGPGDGPPPAATGSSAGRTWLRRLGAIQQRYPLMQATALVALFIFGSVTLTGFATYSTIKTVLIITSFLGIAAVGQQIAILIGGIDLAVPAFMAFGNFVIPQLVGIDGWPFMAALALQLVVAASVGAASGFICNHFKVEPLVVTLGIGSIVLGGLSVWTNGLVDASAPEWLSRFTSPASHTFGVDIPPVVVFWAVIAVLMAVLLHRTVIGRRIYAAGSNPRAAAVALVPVRRIWMFAFALSAVSASIAGLLLAGFSGTGNIRIGDPYLFSSLAAVVVGGTALIGARGDYWRTVLGALLLTVLTTILIGHGLGQQGQQIFYGIVILLVVPAYGRDRRTADQI